MLTPDLKQNAIVALYLLFIHNYVVFAYVGGTVISIIIALIRPSRFIICMALGFAVLAFAFEYDKHLIVPLREQTLKSLITITPHYKLEKLINLGLSNILPMFLYICGWSLIYIAIIIGNLHMTQKKKN